MEEKDIYSELSSIRNLMERSTKFISLSGLSGVMAGIYALIGAYLGCQIIKSSDIWDTGEVMSFHLGQEKILQLFLIATLVLVLSLTTGVWLTIRQANKKGESSWNPVSRRLLFNMAIPLFTGGLFILILIFRGDFALIAPSSLLFYGLALVAGSSYTFSDVKWLGFCEIFLGLFSALLPGYEIIFWALGFGVLHILYGAIMHFKYNQ
ncbi:MAG: hypothetical protein KKG25_03850 [Bacteroidetes bacterium]|nr:hypothetical protein [Bacteroidota bacterium]MBU1483979.1 hypothetical protein [Bacteroidota bacterium]MBU1759701.1 hypothetical protein [Bacteroidota bacterium]MBU2268166.1 hypothetical protein [Bacteroidota bacterium]MBU2374583.1 hypothetical protein [Bacteroidota bacterium]